MNKTTIILATLIIISANFMASAETIQKTNTKNIDSYVISNVPYISQETNIFCSYASYAMILDSFENIDTSLEEILFLAGVGYSTIYSNQDENNIPKIGTILCQSTENVGSYFGYTADLWVADYQNNTDEQCWNEYYKKIKENITNNNPIITTVNPFRLSSLRGIVDFEINDKIIDIGPKSGHGIVILGFNENNNSICFNDPLPGYFGKPEKGTYCWMDIKTFKKAITDVYSTNGFPYLISSFVKTKNPILSKNDRFKKSHENNIQRLKGNISAYNKKHMDLIKNYLGINDCRYGINATRSFQENYKKNIFTKIKTINNIKKQVKLGLIYRINTKIIPKILKKLNLPPSSGQKFTQNSFDRFVIEKEYTSQFLFKNNYDSESYLFGEESYYWNQLSKCYSIFQKKGYLLSFAKSLKLINEMNENIEKIIDIQNKIINNYKGTFEENINSIMKHKKLLSISAGIIKDNEIAWYGGYGTYKGINTKIFAEKPDINTIYMAGSISKAITATAVMQLYEKGFFDLDDPVSNYLPFNLVNPNFPKEKITIKMLLNHTSSLSSFDDIFSLLSYSGLTFIMGYPMPFFKETLSQDGRFYKKEYWRDDYPPGIDFEYSNIGFGLLEHVVEFFSGQSFEEYCKENIFEPLEMYDTSFHHRDLKSKDLAPVYIYKNGKYKRLPKFDVPLCGAGSLRTSVFDLSHLLITHMNDGIYKDVKILEKTTIEKMHNTSSDMKNLKTASRIFDFPEYVSFYGHGWMIYNKSYYGFNYSGHDGDVPGSHAIMRMDTDNNIGYILFWNNDVKNNKPGGPWDFWIPIEREMIKKSKNI